MTWQALHEMPSGEAFWICRFAVCALRAEPDHRSEMVSQLLWGEPQQILDMRGGWLLVRGLLDGYVGWVPVGSLVQAFRTTSRWAVVRVRWAPLFREKRLHSRVPVGAIVPADGIWHTATGRYRVAAGHLLPWPAKPRPIRVGRAYAIFSQTPYLWGGKSPAGIDCSGLTQITYRLAGWLLPRDAADQAAFTTPTPHPRPGDLAFYTSPQTHRISHVALYQNPNTILHATPANGVALTPPHFNPQLFPTYRTLIS
jgi:hypothetical protein